MRAINHTITGALVGAVIVSPAIALPAALLSHLVLDIIPHYGGKDHLSFKFKVGLIADAAACLAFFLAIFLLRLKHWPLLIACGALGASLDLWWFPYWLLEVRGKHRAYDPIGQFLSDIQWCEKPWGVYVEVAWGLVMFYIFFRVTA